MQFLIQLEKMDGFTDPSSTLNQGLLQTNPYVAQVVTDVVQ